MILLSYKALSAPVVDANLTYVSSPGGDTALRISREASRDRQLRLGGWDPYRQLGRYRMAERGFSLEGYAWFDSRRKTGAERLPRLQSPHRSEFGVEGDEESPEELDNPGVFGLESARLIFTRATPLSVKPIFSAARFDRSRLRPPT